MSRSLSRVIGSRYPSILQLRMEKLFTYSILGEIPIVFTRNRAFFWVITFTFALRDVSIILCLIGITERILIGYSFKTATIELAWNHGAQ